MKTLPLVVTAVAFLALSGVAFAWSNGGDCGEGDHHGHGCSASPGLVWASPSGTTVSAPWVACTSSFSGGALTIAVSGLAPGSSCVYAGTLQNVGSRSVTLNETVTAHEPAGCPAFVYADDLVGLAHPPTLYGGHAFAYGSTISLASGAGNVCQGVLATFTISIGSASASTPCEGFPHGFEEGTGGDDNCCH